MPICCPDRYKTQEICKVIDDCLVALKFIPDWFVTNKMLEKSQYNLLADVDILIFDEDFSTVTFFANEWVFVVYMSIKLTLIYDFGVRLLAWHNKVEKHNTPEKDGWRTNACTVACIKIDGIDAC